MRMILGLDAPEPGQALVGGRPYQALRSPLPLIGSLLDASALQSGRGVLAAWAAAAVGAGGLLFYFRDA